MGRLADLGFDTYADYLRSPHWRERRRIAGNAAAWMCACGAQAVEVHHRTYRRLGRERDSDLRAVCARCHEAIHELCEQGTRLAAATDAVLKGREAAASEPLRGAWHPGKPLRGDVVRPEPKPRQRRGSKPVLTQEQRESNERLRGQWRRKKKTKQEPKPTAECPPVRD